jgi:two-component system sensor histidine kinase SenX3
MRRGVLVEEAHVREGDGRPRHFLSAEGSGSCVSRYVANDHSDVRGLVESVNHHLRTPVAAILLHAELLVAHGDELPTEVQGSLDCILRGGQRLKDVVVGICDLVEAACVHPDTMVPIDVSELLAQEVAVHRDRAALRGVRLSVACDHGVTCVGDSSRLRRALRELLDNAVTYAPDRSTVRVAATVAVTGIRITVRDQGTGIDRADRERLVRAFERGTHPRQATAGLGMGLGLVSAVASGHGGQLVLTDAPGGGLEASLELPRMTASRERVIRDGPDRLWSADGGALLEGQHGQLDSGVDVELEVDVLEVGVDGVSGEMKLLGHAAVAHPSGHECNDAQLAVGE